jgi:hypothetical protein
VAFIYINYGSNRNCNRKEKNRREKKEKCNVIRFQVVCSRHKKSLKACKRKMSKRENETG